MLRPFFHLAAFGHHGEQVGAERHRTAHEHQAGADWSEDAANPADRGERAATRFQHAGEVESWIVFLQRFVALSRSDHDIEGPGHRAARPGRALDR